VATRKVKSVGTRRFWNLFSTLPPEVRKLAVKTYDLWRKDPNHSSLRFRRLKGSKDGFTVRIGDHYRALGRLDGDTITWVWIGSHSEYDQLLR
jgi:hypothetical protein